MAKFLNDLKFSIPQLYRAVVVCGAMLGSLWLFAGPFVKSYAGDAFVEMLIEQGVDPKAFAEIQQKATEIVTQTDGLATDLDKAKADIRTIIVQNSALQEQGNRTEILVQKLLDLQLRQSGNLQ